MIPIILVVVSISILIIGLMVDEEILIVMGFLGSGFFLLLLIINFLLSPSDIDNKYHLETIQGYKLTTIQIPYIKDESKDELTDRILNFFQTKNRKAKAEKIKELDLKLEYKIIEEKEEQELQIDESVLEYKNGKPSFQINW